MLARKLRRMDEQFHTPVKLQLAAVKLIPASRLCKFFSGDARLGAGSPATIDSCPFVPFC